ncbi:protein YgfX [Legionella cardiaca]|uniref:protein YgfX n=1 Tax=Legionella cardiaca TaxID=1071983 RepID=UPI003B848EA4
MLSSSNCTIKFGKSSYFLRIALLIYFCAFLLIVYSEWALWLKLLTCIPLSLEFLYIIKNPVPYTNYLQLSHNNQKWFLHTNNTTIMSYDRIRIIINAGLFFLLELENITSRKMLVIFTDQVSADTYRHLKIKEKYVQN